MNQFFFVVPMTNTNNTLLTTKIFDALFRVIGRRTLDSFAIQILKTTVEKLAKNYECFTMVTINDEVFSEDGIKVSFMSGFETFGPSQLGEALEALISVIYLELTETIGDDVGLYFVTELKNHLGDSTVDELRSWGIHFERIQTEQHMRYQNKSPHLSHKQTLQRESEATPYTWESVSTWKYEDNICLLYDNEGRLLDTLQLDLIVEEYVERVTESRQRNPLFTPQTTMIKMTEKDHELLEMIRRRDTDVDSAVNLLHISRQKFDTIIQKLLSLEMLQYISDSEVKLTEKGLQYLANLPKK